MYLMKNIFLFSLICFMLNSCVSKKKYDSLQSELELANLNYGQSAEDISRLTRELSACEQEKARLQASGEGKEQQLSDLRAQIADIQEQRDRQLEQVEDLTNLSKTASDNVTETLAQMSGKDRYIRYLQEAKTRADSINLALAVNLKSVLADGIEDEDVDVNIDKTVVFVNLSDKMLYQSGSYNITSRASEVLGKIAQIVQSKPDLEIMIEGYTDNVPINTACVNDNWDLSVLRATSVARALQLNHGVDPNRIIAAGRGQYNALVSNDTAAGRSTNRRTRIIILPKLNQFYDLLNPGEAPE